jgi:hypothetical protein
MSMLVVAPPLLHQARCNHEHQFTSGSGQRCLESTDDHGELEHNLPDAARQGPQPTHLQPDQVLLNAHGKTGRQMSCR